MCSVQTVTLYIHLPLSISYARHTWASITKTRAPQWPNNTSESNAGSKKSICPGKSQIYQKQRIGLLVICMQFSGLSISWLIIQDPIQVLNFMQCSCVYFHEVNVTLQSNLISPGTVQMSYLIYLSGKLRVLHICIKCLCTMEKLEI